MEIKQNKSGKYQCPCCGYYTFIDKPINTFQDCPVCDWEVDGVQQDDPDYLGGANSISLNHAKENYKRFGAFDEKFILHCRPPKEDEMESG